MARTKKTTQSNKPKKQTKTSTSSQSSQHPLSTHQTKDPDLKPVLVDRDELPENRREGPFRFCRLVNDNELIVRIKNHGGKMPSDPETFKVQVDFQRHGTKFEETVKRLDEGEVSDDIPVALPKDAFNPICDFNINIFVGDTLHSQTKGICTVDIRDYEP